MDLPGVQLFTFLLFFFVTANYLHPAWDSTERQTYQNLTPVKQHQGEHRQTLTMSRALEAKPCSLGEKEKNGKKCEATNPIVFASLFAERSFNCKNGCINPVPKL